MDWSWSTWASTLKPSNEGWRAATAHASPGHAAAVIGYAVARPDLQSHSER